MKRKRIFSLVASIAGLALVPTTWAATHNDGGGFAGGGFTGGGARGGGAASRGGGVGFGRPGFSSRPGYYYSRGMHSMAPGAGQLRAPVRGSPSFARPNHVVTSSGSRPGSRPVQTSQGSMLNGRTDHVAERHNSNWHTDWDRRHAHFFHNRFFVFDNGFWFGLDPGFFPWDYYPYSC